MKKQFLLIAGLVFIDALAFGGGIVTNSNQSAYWVRTLVRDAAIGPDAVYFNPAGLTRMEDGFHFSLNSQTIFQNKDVTSDYIYLNPTPKKYLGEAKAPVFPGAYATWKKNKIAVSFGFNPIGGGGSATFKTGLPSFELSIADLAKAFESQGATDYRLDAYLKGTSVFFGYQGGISYKINDMISVFGGVRYVTGKNTYEGHLKDIDLLMGGNWIPASNILQGVATSASDAANMVQAAIDGGVIGASDPISQTLANNLIAFGVDPTGFTNAIAVVALGQASDGYNAKAALLAGQEVDVVEKGAGFTPILGVNFSFEGKLNIGIKYEFRTKIEVENETTKDFILGYSGSTPITMFPNGEKIDNDLPAMFSLGVDYKIIPKLSATAGFHYYFDKSANYGKQLNGEYVDNSEVIDKNYYEIATGLEYGITDNVFISGGYLFAKSGVGDDYQSDLSYSLTSNSIGGGLGIKLTEKFMVNAGFLYSIYNEGKKTYDHIFPAVGNPILKVTDTYFENNLVFALGIDFSF
ncbi:MAG TPA: outer membrane protein transport protein [Bacteroidales bacterium]|nr:outer membrane protein transport protein [Bacteroidales bacterium]